MADTRAQAVTGRRPDDGYPAGHLERINLFSLVSYIPGELGDFLTELREELVQGCIARAHVTVLPPRPLAVEPMLAEQHLRERLPEFPAFRIEMPQLARFDNTYVVFAEVGAGRDRLVQMHSDLNSGPLRFAEPYEFHPHVTLAQGLTSETLPEVFEAACRRWREAPRPRAFAVETLTFVQNTVVDRWLDLAHFALADGVPAGVTD